MKASKLAIAILVIVAAAGGVAMYFFGSQAPSEVAVSQIEPSVPTMTSQGVDQSKSLPASRKDARKANPILREYQSAILPDAKEWAVATFIDNPNFAKYDRFRLVDIDWNALLMPIEGSQEFLAASSGAAVSSSPATEFHFELFEDRPYLLMIQRAKVRDVNGTKITTLSGAAYDESDGVGSWTMALDSVNREISGVIDGPAGYITYGPGPDRVFHVFREISQENREKQMADKTY